MYLTKYNMQLIYLIDDIDVAFESFSSVHVIMKTWFFA